MLDTSQQLAPTPLECNFGALMDLYERNYLRLRLLLPDLESIDDQAVSEVPDCIGLYVKVIERSRFTTTLRLHYAFAGQEAEKRAPYLKIRIYHDARTAEAMTGMVHRHAGAVDFAGSLTLRWRRNRFLYKWLGYCLRRGHRFRDRHNSGAVDACELTL